MVKICLAFWKSEPQYAYKRYACKKTCISKPYNQGGERNFKKGCQSDVRVLNGGGRGIFDAEIKRPTSENRDFLT